MDIDCIRRLLQDGSVIQSEVVLGLNHVKVVWFVPSCYPVLASFTHLHGFDGLGIHPYGHPLHGKVLKHFIYLLDGSVIQSEVALCLNPFLWNGLYPVVTQVWQVLPTSMALMV